MPLLLIDRFHPRLRHKQQAMITQGTLQQVDAFDALHMDNLRALARLSLLLFAGGIVLFGGESLLVSVWRGETFTSSLSFWNILLWLIMNALSYMLILPLHELIHALAFLFWGGKPYFGAKLPLALYCGARQQLFRRNHYVMVGLAPCVLITLASVLLIFAFPLPATYVLLATSGNFAGSAGDIWAVRRLLHLPAHVLIEDTETGYRAWEFPPDR